MSMKALIEDTPVKEFMAEFERVDRVWDHTSKEGITKSQAIDRGLQKFRYILERSDGWSIAATYSGLKSCYDLWDDEWVAIYKMDS